MRQEGGQEKGFSFRDERESFPFYHAKRNLAGKRIREFTTKTLSV